jgi:hypothetical protein
MACVLTLPIQAVAQQCADVLTQAESDLQAYHDEARRQQLTFISDGVIDMGVKATLRNARAKLLDRTSPRDPAAALLYKNDISAWEQVQRIFGVTMEDLGRCIQGSIQRPPTCGLLDFAARQNEALRANEQLQRFVESTLPNATRDTLNRVRQAQRLVQNNVERLTGNATRGMTGAVSCLDVYATQAQSNAPLSETTRLSGGSPVKAIVAGSAAAAGGAVAIKSYQDLKKSEREAEELAAETQRLINTIGTSSGSTGSTSGGSTSTGGSTSGGVNGTFSVTASYSCTSGGTSASEPCNRAVANLGCDPLAFSFTVTNGVLRDSCSWLTGSVSSGGVFSGRYTGTASLAMPMSGTLPSSGSVQWTGSDSHRGNSYRITLTVTRR